MTSQQNPWDYPGQQTQTTPQPQAPSQPLPPPQQQAASPSFTQRLRQREDLILNILLYLASLLIVSAAGVFLSVSAGALLKIIMLLAGVFLFYGAGIATYALVPKLRLASYSFVGTALAILPFAALAYYNEYQHSGRIIWLVTSLLGTLAVLGATLKMHGRVMAYIFIAFLASDTLALTKVIGLGLTWYFVSLLILATALAIFTHLRPIPLPGSLERGLLDASEIFVPGLVISLIFYQPALSPLGLSLILALATLHALTFFLLKRSFSQYLQARLYPFLCLFSLGALLPQGSYPSLPWASALLALALALALPNTPWLQKKIQEPTPNSRGFKLTWTPNFEAHLNLGTSALLIALALAVDSFLPIAERSTSQNQGLTALLPFTFGPAGLVPSLWFLFPLYLLAFYRWYSHIRQLPVALTYSLPLLLLVFPYTDLTELGITLALATFVCSRIWQETKPTQALSTLPAFGYVLSACFFFGGIVDFSLLHLIILGFLLCGALGPLFIFRKIKNCPQDQQESLLIEAIIFTAISAVGALTFAATTASASFLINAEDPALSDVLFWCCCALLFLFQLSATLPLLVTHNWKKGPGLYLFILTIIIQYLGLTNLHLSAITSYASYIYLILHLLLLVLGIRPSKNKRLVFLFIRTHTGLLLYYLLSGPHFRGLLDELTVLIAACAILAGTSLIVYRRWPSKIENILFGIFLGLGTFWAAQATFSYVFRDNWLPLLVSSLFLALALAADKVRLPSAAFSLGAALSSLGFNVAMVVINSPGSPRDEETLLLLIMLLAATLSYAYTLFLDPGWRPVSAKSPDFLARLASSRSRWATFPQLLAPFFGLIYCLLTWRYPAIPHSMMWALMVFMILALSKARLGFALTTSALVFLLRLVIPTHVPFSFPLFLEIIVTVLLVIRLHRKLGHKPEAKGILAQQPVLYSSALALHTLAVLIQAASPRYEIGWHTYSLGLAVTIFFLVVSALDRRLIPVIYLVCLVFIQLNVLAGGFNFALLFLLGLALIGFVVYRLLKRPSQEAPLPHHGPDHQPAASQQLAIPYPPAPQASASQPATPQPTQAQASAYQPQPWDYPGNNS